MKLNVMLGKAILRSSILQNTSPKYEKLFRVSNAPIGKVGIVVEIKLMVMDKPRLVSKCWFILCYFYSF